MRGESTVNPLTIIFTLAIGSCGTIAPAFSQSQPAFRSLGDLPDGGFWSWAFSVSADGSVIVGAGTPDGKRFPDEAFRWENGIMNGISDLSGGTLSFAISEAYDVSADGSVIVGISIHEPGTEAVRWDDNGIRGLGDFPGGIFFSWANAVSADGSVIIGFGNGDHGARAYRWTEIDGMVQIPSLDQDPGDGFQSFADGVSADGTVIVGSTIFNNQYEAFRWTEDDGIVGLGHLPGGFISSLSWDVSADGSVVVGSSSSSQGLQAFRWTAEVGMEGLGDLPGGDFLSIARGVSADGSIIVGRATSQPSSPSSRPSDPFIWDAQHGMRSLRDILVNEFGVDLTGWGSMQATNISADGTTIVGWGKNPDDKTEAWVATIIRDSDNDGIPDNADICPQEDATGIDANGDGCIDSVAGLNSLIENGLTIERRLRTSFLAIANAAAESLRRGSTPATRHQLQALINLAQTQQGKMISHQHADLLITFVQNSMDQLTPFRSSTRQPGGSATGSIKDSQVGRAPPAVDESNPSAGSARPTKSPH